MNIGEVCLLTNNVRKLADFYKKLLETDNNSDDDTHQFIISEGTNLTVPGLSCFYPVEVLQIFKRFCHLF